VSSRLSRRWVSFAALVLVGGPVLCASTSGPVPAGVILVKGAWSSSAGTAIPLPEDGAVANGKYGNAYFGLEYAFGSDWTQRYEGPPPSESGYYVLAQLEPGTEAQSLGQGHVLIAAQDLFFTRNPAHDALELIHHYQEHLGVEYRVQRPPTKVRVANRDFVRFDYLSRAAGLRWHVLATQIRCHVVLFTFTGSDTQITRRLIDSIGTMPQAPGGAPVCIKDYANAETVTEREDPVLAAPRVFALWWGAAADFPPDHRMRDPSQGGGALHLCCRDRQVPGQQYPPPRTSIGHHLEASGKYSPRGKENT